MCTPERRAFKWYSSLLPSCRHTLVSQNLCSDPRTVLTEETLDEIDASLECTPTKFIPKFAQQMGISESSAHRATNLLQLKPYKCTSVYRIKQGDPVSQMHYCE